MVSSVGYDKRAKNFNVVIQRRDLGVSRKLIDEGKKLHFFTRFRKAVWGLSWAGGKRMNMWKWYYRL